MLKEPLPRRGKESRESINITDNNASMTLVCIVGRARFADIFK